MQIKWHGQSCFQITAQPCKGEKVNIVIDPFSKGLGLRAPSLTAEILLITHSRPDHNNIKAIHPVKSREAGAAKPQFNRVKSNPFLINGPGEYDIKKVFARGIPALHNGNQDKNKEEITIYTIEAEEINLCHLGGFSQDELSPSQLEKLGQIDILMIPVGGGDVINGSSANKIINQLEPKIVIPMHYQIPKLNLKLEKIDGFLKAMGQKAPAIEEKLVIKKKDLPEEGAKIVLLSP